MGQRRSILTEILDFPGWKVVEYYFETSDGARVVPLAGHLLSAGVRLVLSVERRWAPRCSHCDAIGATVHERLAPRRWSDLPWAGHPVLIEYAPVRLDCSRCDLRKVEFLSWAGSYQRQTRRLQQHLAIMAASMPVLHVAALHELSWSTVRRAEGAALARWDKTRPPVELHMVGIDEKWLGRRHKLDHKFKTVVSNLETGEPIWIGAGRNEATLASWLATLTPEQKASIKLFSMDMHRPYRNAIGADPALSHAVIVHDAFHVMKRAGQAVDEMRRQVFFRAGPELRRVGKGSRWLLLRAWERCSPEQQERIDFLLPYNAVLARAYQAKEELREVLHAPDRASMEMGLKRVLRRLQLRKHVPLRKLHDSLVEHRERILAIGEHRPPSGRVEALNNNWEALVRRGRGYRDHSYLLLKLRFATANPIRTASGVDRFLALGHPTPLRKAGAA